MFSGANPEQEILISSFSHKGGVGKTTGAYNIACVLAKDFKCKVLLIDADPQSNLTSVVMHQKFRRLGREAFLQDPANILEEQNHQGRKKKRKTRLEKEIEKERISEEAQRGEEIFYESRANKKRNTLYKCFQTISGEFSQVADENEILRRVEKEIEVEKIEEYGDLFFLPGDLNVLTLDNDLNKGFAFGGQSGFGAFAKYPGTISRLFRAIANKCGANIILVDLNPNASALNQAIVMGSDYFLVSNLADFYSRRAINSISHVITDWNDTTIPFRNVERTTPFFRMPEAPKFLGYLFNRVKIRTGRPTLGQNKRIKLIDSEVEQKILSLANIVTNNYQRRQGAVIIKEFDRTAAEAVESGIPMAYVDFNKLEDKNTLREPGVRQQQEFYLNAYFGAIRVLFRGLSDEHHRIFGDRFKNLVLPPRTTVPPATPKASQAKRYKREKQPLLTGFLDQIPIYFEVQPNIGAGNCSVLALGVEREEVGLSLMQGIDNQDIRNLLEQEIFDAFYDEDLETPRFNELFQTYNTHHQDYENHKNKLVQRFAEFENISEEEKITKATALGDDPDAVAFLTASRQSEQARNELRNYVKEVETVRLFIGELVMNDHRWLGTRTLRAYARLNDLSLRIWKRSNNDQNRVEINNQEQPEIGTGRTIDILYSRGNHFEALRQKPAPAQQQAQNPLQMDGPLLMLSGGPKSTQASSQANNSRSKASGKKRKAPA